MCISNGPARFSTTKGYIGRTKKKKSTVVMAYQMEAQAIGEGLRAIILQIPATKIVKIHDTTKYNKFLDEMVKQIGESAFSPIFGVIDKLRSHKSLSRGELKSQTIGMYEVVVLDNYEQFNTIADIFPEGKVPTIQDGLANFYKENYSDWKYIVATFDNKTPMSAQPFMVEYESTIIMAPEPENGEYQEMFVFTALDNGNEEQIHDGLPKQGVKIQEDHLIAFPHEKGLEVKYSQPVPTNLISNRVGWYQLDGFTENGDYIVFADGKQIRKIPISWFAAQTVKSMTTDERGLKTTHKSNAYTNW